jgi:hypothetical protein
MLCASHHSLNDAMPSRLALSTRAYSLTQRDAYVCPSCLLQAANKALTPLQPRAKVRKLSREAIPLPVHRAVATSTARPTRSDYKIPQSFASGFNRRHSNGSLVSSTAINAPSSVPQKYRELHQSLLALQEAASSYADRSRLQLSLRSLESGWPVVRVALLGLGRHGPAAARRLARALLSDALGEEETWELELMATTDDGRSILLKYGDSEDVLQGSSLVKTINVPSRYLERHNLEILITPFNSNGNGSISDSNAIEDAILVPSLTTPNASDGRVGFVRYPVHKSVIVAEGVTGAIEYGKLPSTLAESKLIKAVVNIALVQPLAANGTEATNPAFDIDLANHALELFRTSRANGAQFSDEWQTSRIPKLSGWIAGSQLSAASSMNEATAHLISSVLSRTALAATTAEALATELAAASTIPEAGRAQLHSGIAIWSAKSHKDLQTNLDTAFATSKSWRRTVWWRLFWRIDDVAVSASDVLRQSWLTEAEQRLAFLSGQILESGVASIQGLQRIPPVDAEVDEPGRSGQLTSTPSQLTTMQSRSETTTPFDFPWPPTISLTRLYMLNALVPEFHRKAQTLIVSTLSTITGSAGLASLFYAATGGVALYESGAILSFGLVWSLRRLQKKWEKERSDFASATREDARRVLGDVERHLRRLVQQGGRVMVNPEDVKSREDAMMAIERSRQALEKAIEGQRT